jgi:hypothetical protein
VPRLALSVGEACKALGISWDLWHEHVEADVRIVRLGRRKLIAVDELERWLDDHGERVLEPRTADQAAEKLAVPPSWLLREARTNRVPHVRLGR